MPNLNKIVIINYPDCWEDDVRMDALFAPFRLRSINPENYDSKLRFWRTMIFSYGQAKGAADFTAKELCQGFMRKNKLPMCLQDVIDDMLVSKEIRIKKLFMNDPLDGWYSWAVDAFVKRPISWGFRKFKDTVVPVLSGSDDDEPEYVNLELLKKQSETLMETLVEKFAGKILLYKDFLENVADLQMSNKGLEIILHYLHSKRQLYVEYTTTESGGKEIHLIKVPKTLEPGTVSPPTDIERSVCSLEQTEKNLLKSIEEIESEVKKNEAAARQYIKDGKRLMAKGCLKKKHILEKKTEKRSAALENIQTLLNRLQDTESDGLVFNAYKLGSKAMRSLLSDSGIDCDNVDEVMCEIKEAFDIHDDVQQSLAKIGSNEFTTVNEDSLLEEELCELLEEDKPAKEKPKVIKQPVQPSKKTDMVSFKNFQESEWDEELLKELEDLEIITTPLPVINLQTKEQEKTTQDL